MNISNSILDTIGRTPMVRINALNPNPQVNIYAKIEGFNPSGSIKDRIAREMVEVAERTGALKPGKTIIEATSGNTGIGLAMVGIVKGYHVVIVMSEGVSVERRKILKAMGAEIVLTPADAGTDGAITKAREMVEADPDRYYMPDQFANAANYMTHYQRGQLYGPLPAHGFGNMGTDIRTDRLSGVGHRYVRYHNGAVALPAGAQS